MQYIEALDWLYSFNKYGSKLGLERISALLSSLGNPHKSLQIIHVTGSNGKGSVCKYIASVLQHAGYQTGVYISPHLQRFSERITINGIEISEKEIAQVLTSIRPHVDALNQQNIKLTFFEITTALAFLYFSKQKVDYAVIEVGLGGRFDATNVITPLVSVITNITMEHADRLGKTIEAIAFEKAGIIKTECSVITASEGTAFQVISKIAQKHNASVIEVKKTIWNRIQHTLYNQTFTIQGTLKEYTVETSQLGMFQGENIAVALHSIEQLQVQGIFISDDDIFQGIKEMFHPGRVEILQTRPILLLDGAHNAGAIKELIATLSSDFTYTHLIFVLGILKDKNIKTMLATILPKADRIVFTQSANPRACNPGQLFEIALKQGYKNPCFVEPNLEKAITLALKSALPEDLICITGSLFTVGEARDIFQKKKSLITDLSG